jgi:hypothetical protein
MPNSPCLPAGGARPGDDILKLWAAIAFALMAAGCSAVEREAAAFPNMPHNPVYYRLDGRQLPTQEAIASLQAAASECRNQIPVGASEAPPLGSPAFDSCMRSQGYARAR